MKQLLPSRFTGQARNKEQYTGWIRQQDMYFTFRLSDGSDWLMREGNDKERYIHIHPGKNSRQSRRIKSRSLAIFMAMLYYSRG
ncbi:MAG: hypothetical protein ACQESZ_10235 [Bacteroidota bacterium]